MKELAASFVLFFVISSIRPDFCAGLQCKQGTAHRGPNSYTHEDIYNNSTCPADDKYCSAATCTKAGAGAFSRILWMCAAFVHKEFCIRIAEKETRKVIQSTKIPYWTEFDCKCDFGPEGEDFSNAKFEILPIPISNILICKKGDSDLQGYGHVFQGNCWHDEDKYCYMASCAKGNKHVMTVWNCSPNTNCSAISAKVGKTENTTVTCECLFGKANANLANENFTLPMVPTINADKPTKNADKPTNTTAEANLGVRAIIPVGSGVLLAIGHVLASVLPKLGVGRQLFNDL